MKVKEMHNWYQTCRIHSHLIPYVIGNEQYDGLYFSKQIYGLFIYNFSAMLFQILFCRLPYSGWSGFGRRKLSRLRKGREIKELINFFSLR